MEKENELSASLAECRQSQNRVKVLAEKLSEKEEELNKERAMLESRLKECDACEQQLMVWQQELDSTSEMLVARENDIVSRDSPRKH
jgi:chromosome segregation ATPase